MSYVRWPGKTLRPFVGYANLNSTPIDLAAQFEAFRTLMGSQPAQFLSLGSSAQAADASCLNASTSTDELHDCINRLKRNKSPGIDGVCYLR